MDHGVPETTALQSTAGSEHRSSSHHPARQGIVPLLADDGREKKEMTLAGRLLMATPVLVTPETRRPCGRRQAPFPPERPSPLLD